MNLIGIDFEDWYHPELVQKHVRDLEHEPSMFKGLDKIIDMLRRNDTSATFFVVGELLEKNLFFLLLCLILPLLCLRAALLPF